MNDMFTNAISFNQPLKNWNVSNVTDMTLYVLLVPLFFNQPLDHWTRWNVSNVTDMEGDVLRVHVIIQPIFCHAKHLGSLVMLLVTGSRV